MDPAPGVETQLGTSPDIGNPHANSMLQQLIEISIQDEVKLQQAKREYPENLELWPEGVLSSLMRAIDTTLWDTDRWVNLQKTFLHSTLEDPSHL